MSITKVLPLNSYHSDSTSNNRDSGQCLIIMHASFGLRSRKQANKFSTLIQEQDHQNERVNSDFIATKIQAN